MFWDYIVSRFSLLQQWPETGPKIEKCNFVKEFCKTNVKLVMYYYALVEGGGGN